MLKQSFLLWSAAALAVGGLSWLLARSGMENTYPLLEKSSLTPPDFIFPLVWSILYVLMGVGLAAVFRTQKPGLERAGQVWAVQLGLNFLWSLLFFRWGLYGWALVCLILLWLAIGAMVRTFAFFSRKAAAMQLPYFLWVGFAGWLNYTVWRLN